MRMRDPVISLGKRNHVVHREPLTAYWAWDVLETFVVGVSVDVPGVLFLLVVQVFRFRVNLAKCSSISR